MKVLIDSSAMAKRYVKEAGSFQLQKVLQKTTQLGFCSILVPEVISG